ncbi:hypothetical protein WKI71_09495 [Streptomyces sp. MS1.AVA.1]|uniref:Secreted protein n=1 Tax=Streptomyces machairae TaxID=3134109 RepID=A0ABU8UIB1_9ACTN
MAVSLGMRISGLLVVGAVAVAAAAFTSDGRGSADGRGGDGSVVTAGPSEGGSGPTAPADRSAPVAQQSPNGRAGENASGPAVVPSGLPGGVVSASPSPSPTPSPSGRGTVVLQAPPWLPPGPSSPDSDDTPDPASVYDLLRAPERCASALGKIPQASAEAEWQLLRGLSAACLAVQGRGGDWDTAAGAHAGLAGRVDTCKGRAAYAVLGGLLDFHRRHPGGTVRLAATPGGTPACGYRIAGVDTGGDGEARPGDTIGIELTGTYFDHAELLRDASVSIGGLVVPGVPVLKPESGDRLVLSVPAPPLEPGPAEVAVRHAGTEVRLPAAFTVTGPDTVEEPGTGTGATDEPGSPSGAAVSDLGERLSSLGAEVPGRRRIGVIARRGRARLAADRCHRPARTCRISADQCHRLARRYRPAADRCHRPARTCQTSPDQCHHPARNRRPTADQSHRPTRTYQTSPDQCHHPARNRRPTADQSHRPTQTYQTSPDQCHHPARNRRPTADQSHRPTQTYQTSPDQCHHPARNRRPTADQSHRPTQTCQTSPDQCHRPARKCRPTADRSHRPAPRCQTSPDRRHRPARRCRPVAQLSSPTSTFGTLRERSSLSPYSPSWPPP